MPDIDIVIVDRIDNRIRRKILNIARASETAQIKIEALKQSLNFRGLNLGLRNTGIANLDRQLLSLQQQHSRTAAAAVASSTAQESALNRLIASEERAEQASQKRASAAKINAQAEQRAKTQTGAAIEQANQRVRRSQDARFNANQAGLARTRAAESAARQSEERRLAATRRDHEKTENLKQTLAERFRATQASVEASITASNNRVINSTNTVIVKEQSLVAALDRSSLGFQKLAQAGLQAEATQNRVAASQTRLAGPTQLVAKFTTNLTAKQIVAEKANAALAIRQNEAAAAAIDLQLKELRLAGALDRTSSASNRNAGAVDRVTNAHSRQNKILARSITQIRNLLAVYGGYQLLFSVGLGIDQSSQIDNRLINVAEGDSEISRANNLIALRERLFDIAVETRTPVLELATAYQRFDKALELSGKSQQDSLDFTETLTKALKNNGNTAQETASVITQLSQALTSNTLQGEELKSIRENAPIELLQALAKATGSSVERLKELGREGKLTADVVFQAMQNAASGVEDAFANLKVPLPDRLIQFSNLFIDYLGSLERRTGVFEKVGDGIFFIGSNLRSVEKLVVQFAASFAVLKSLKFASFVVSQLIAITTALRGVGIAQAFATGGLSLLGASLAVGVGSLVAYRDEIAVTEDRTVTLGDVMTTEYNRITSIFTELSKSLVSSVGGVPAEGLIQNLVFAFKEVIIFGIASFSSFGSQLELIFQRSASSINTSMSVALKKVIQTASDAFAEVAVLSSRSANSLNPLGRNKQDQDLVEFAIRAGVNSVNADAIGSLDAQIAKNNAEVEKAVQNYEQAFNKAEQAARATVEIGSGILLNEYRETAKKRIEIERQSIDAIQQGDKKLTQSRLEQAQPTGENGLTLNNNQQGRLLESIKKVERERVRIAEISNVRLRELERNTSDVILEHKNLQLELTKELEQTTGLSSERVETFLMEAWVTPIEEAVRQQAELKEATTRTNRSAKDEAKQLREVIERNIAIFSTDALARESRDDFLPTQSVERFNSVASETINVLESTRQEGNVFFESLSSGYTNLISQASEFSMAAQDSFQGAAEGLGRGLSGDKEGFGEFFKGLFNSFINSRNADFNTRLAAAGPGRASQNIRDQGESSRLQQIDSLSGAAQQGVAQLNTEFASLNQTVSSLDSGALSNLIPQNTQFQVSNLRTQISSLSSTLNSVPGDTLSEPFESAQSAATSLGSSASSAIESIVSSSLSAGSGIESIGTSASSAQSEVASFAESTISSLRDIESAARDAARAVASVGGGGGGGGFGLQGFMNGGFTGNGPRNRIAGLVHGQEFVMPAGPTAANRGLLEAMRDGRPIPTANPRPRSTATTNQSQTGEMRVVVNNNARGVRVEARQISREEIMVMIHESQISTINQVSNELDDPNSDFSNRVESNYGVRRFRR